VSGYRNLYVVIEKLSPDAQRIGLTDTVVRNRVELRLRAAGIKPVGTLERADYLYVMIGVVGAAFSVEVTFDRSVTYFDGASMREAAAATWSKSFLGTHGFNATYILGGVDQVLNDFLNAYLRANQ
jgi:predicted phage tail protein